MTEAEADKIRKQLFDMKDLVEMHKAQEGIPPMKRVYLSILSDTLNLAYQYTIKLEAYLHRSK